MTQREYIKLADGRLVEIPTPEEEAAINAGIAADPDTYELTEEEMARLKPIDTPTHQLKGVKGRPRAEITKDRITIRLAPEVTSYFRSTGKGWQTRIEAVLKAHIEKQSS